VDFVYNFSAELGSYSEVCRAIDIVCSTHTRTSSDNRGDGILAVSTWDCYDDDSGTVETGAHRAVDRHVDKHTTDEKVSIHYTHRCIDSAIQAHTYFSSPLLTFLFEAGVTCQSSGVSFV